jgi:hypothetical protein
VHVKLEEVFTACGDKCVVDSAFARGRNEVFIKSCQILPTNTTHQWLFISSEATSLRQRSEKGMRGLWASFNFHAQYAGLNQIRSSLFTTLRIT